jgi:hypothetical protein
MQLLLFERGALLAQQLHKLRDEVEKVSRRDVIRATLCA